jgi:hypothetical protein
MDGSVEGALRSTCRSTIDAVRQRRPKQFGPDVHLNASDEYLAVPGVALVFPDQTKQHGAVDDLDADDANIETDVELRALLGRASSLPPLSAQNLPLGFLLYALVVGDEPADRHAFVRKANPRSAVRPGRIIGSFGERLTRVSEPLLILDDHFDLVLGGGGTVVLNQAAFEQLFRDTETMIKRFPTYVAAVSKALPFDGDGADRLGELCLAHPRLGKKLRAVYENRMFSGVTIEKIRAEAKRRGLDPTRFVKGKKLVFLEEEAETLLKLLNEDFTTGGLSGTQYEIGNKARRTT